MYFSSKTTSLLATLGLLTTTLAAPASNSNLNNAATSPSDLGFTFMTTSLEARQADSQCDGASCKALYQACVKSCDSLSNSDW